MFERHIIAEKAAAGEHCAISTKQHKDQNSSFMELRMDIDENTVKDTDPDLLKADIKAWAKDIVAYAYHICRCRCSHPAQFEVNQVATVHHNLISDNDCCF